jgi:hypothetical protein
MADSIVQGLFGVDPSMYQQQQAALQNAQAQQFAEMSGAQQGQYGAFRGGQMIGNVGANLLGVQDPMLQKATMAKQLAGQFDITSPQGLQQYAQALAQNGAPDLAQMAAARAQQMESTSLSNEKVKYGLEQEKALRDELAKLGPNASDEEYMAVYRKFGGANALGTALERSMTFKDKLAAKQAEQDKLNGQVRDEMLGSALEGKTLVENIRKKVGYDTVGALGGVLSHIPMTSAAEFSSDVKELQSKLTMAVLAAAKAQSKTGATGFGALNMKELEVIKQNIADLDQSKLSPEKFNEKLDTINKYFNKLEQKSNGTYNPRDTGSSTEGGQGKKTITLKNGTVVTVED